GGSFTELDEVTQAFLRKLMERPEINYAQSSFNTKYPQYEILIDVPRAKEAGVSVSDILGTMQGYVGGIYTADFSRFGKQYRVFVQALPEDRAAESDMTRLFVRTGSGAMAPITQFASLKRIYGPETVTRCNLFNA